LLALVGQYSRSQKASELLTAFLPQTAIVRPGIKFLGGKIHRTGLEVFEHFIFLALVVELELVFEIEIGEGVVVDGQVDLIARSWPLPATGQFWLKVKAAVRRARSGSVGFLMC
jgi:hypothetical protein